MQIWVAFVDVFIAIETCLLPALLPTVLIRNQETFNCIVSEGSCPIRFEIVGKIITVLCEMIGADNRPVIGTPLRSFLNNKLCPARYDSQPYRKRKRTEYFEKRERKRISSGIMNATDLGTESSSIVNLSRRLPMPSPEPPIHLLAATTSMYSIIFLCGIGGNALVFMVFISNRTLRTFINFLFLNLSMADFLVLLISGPTAVLDIYAKEVWYLGGVMCKTVPFVENMVANASILSILAVSVERYRVASSALYQHGSSNSVALKTIVVIWMVSGTVAFPILVITKYKTEVMLDGTQAHVCTTMLSVYWQKVYVLSTTVVFFLIPFVFLVMLYSLICIKVLSSRRNEVIPHSQEIQRLKKQLLLIVLTVVLVFFICQSPYRAIILWMLFDKSNSVRNLGFVGYLSLIYFTRILLYLNHAINPFLYNFVSRRFRRALVVLCCKRYRRQSFEDLRERKRKLGLVIQNRLRRGHLEHCKCLSPRHRPRHRQNDFLMLYENLID